MKPKQPKRKDPKLTEWDKRFIKWLSDDIFYTLQLKNFIKYFDKKYNYPHGKK